MKQIYNYCLLCTLSALGTTYYVAPNGIKNNLGTIDAPLTLQEAAYRAKAGDIIILRGGKYTASNISDPILKYTYEGGNITNHIVFKNMPGEIPILKPYVYNVNPKDPDLSGSWTLVKIYPCLVENQLVVPAYLDFEGLVFEGDAMTITDAEYPLYENQKGAYCIDSNKDGFITDESCPWNCPDVHPNQKEPVDNIPNGCESVRYNGQGLLVTGPFAWDPDIKNLIKKPNDPSSKTYYPYAIPHHITVKNCIFREFPSAGISFQRADYITVDNCTIANNCWYTIFGSSGINMYQMVSWEGTNPMYHTNEYRIKIVNNICYGNTLKVQNQNLPVRYDGNGIIIDDFVHTQDYIPGNIYTNPNRGDFKYPIYGGRTLVANNVLFGNGGSGIKVYSSQNIDVFHNTLFNNGIGNYRYFRTNTDNDVKIKGHLVIQYGLYIQSIVDEQSIGNPKSIIYKGYNRIYNNITYNTIGYLSDGISSDDLAYSVATASENQNNADKNYIGNPYFTNVLIANLELGLPNKINDIGTNFKLLKNSPAINYGAYSGLIPNDKDNYDRDALPDAGAYELPTDCIDNTFIGSNIASNNLTNSIVSNNRKVYRSQKSITINTVFSIPYGSIFTAEVISCNMMPDPITAGRVVINDNIWPINDAREDEHVWIYPNPINGPNLYLNIPIEEYKLINASGQEVLSGVRTDQIDIRGLCKGIYLLYTENKSHKILIE